MRFLLLENVPQITDEMITQWKAEDQATRDTMVDQIIQQYNQKGLENIRSSIRKSFYTYGLDAKVNPFITFFDALAKTNNITKKYDPLASAMIDLDSKGEILVTTKSKSASYMTHPSLWDRSVEDFTYTLRAFDIVQSKNKVSKYFKNVEGIDISGFMLPDGSIKPAGSEATADDTDTIYGTIEAWSDGGNNDTDRAPEKSDTTKLTQGDLKLIKQKHSYTNVSDIPSDEWEDGSIVYLSFADEDDLNDIDKNNWAGSFVIYQNGKWAKYKS